MAGVNLGAALRQIHGLFEAGTVAGLTDGQLLERYLARRDESAFAALVTRHGPMVLGVCHSVLRGAPEVEDAFQATFLVLIRKAGTIRGRDAVGGWLHRVAHRIAVEAGRDRSRRDRRECGTGDLPDLISAHEDLGDDDWRIPLHEELARLPERFRQPLVLCYLEGKTHAQAACELRWSKATLRRRLADARELLHGRLTRRGVALSGAALTAAMASRATAAVPLGWVEALARVAAGPPSGAIVSAAAARLSGGLVRDLFVGRIRIVTNVATVLLATSQVAVHLIPSGPARAGDPVRPTPRRSPPAARQSAPEKKANREQSLAIRGRVLDPDGRPFAGAKIYAYRPDPRGDAFIPAPVPDAISDAGGGFQFNLADSGLQALHQPPAWSQPTVVALAPRFGPGWATFTTSDQAKDLTLRLVKDDVPIEGRILDLEGKAVPGATIRPVLLYASPAEDLGEWESAMAGAKDLSEGALDKLSRDIELFRWSKDLAVTTDAEGRFRMTGIGRERVVSLWIDGPTIATAFVDVYARTRPGPTYRLAQRRDRPKSGRFVFFGNSFDYPAGPTRPIEGTVRDKQTGRPLAGVSIRSWGFAGSEVVGRDHVRTTTGADGRYRLVGMPPGSGNRITAEPGATGPYLGAGADVPGGVGPGPATVDFALQRGITIRGKVTDKTTGQPVPAFVEYFIFVDNPHRAKARALHGRPIHTRRDGSFELEGLPGRGLVAARAETDQYLVGVGADRIAGPRVQGWFHTDPHICQPERLHAIAAIDPAEDVRSVTCNLALDPGLTLSGTVVGPDGQPVTGCTAIDLCPHTMSYNMVKLTSDRFTARGLDPRYPRPLVFRHDGKDLTGVVVVRGDETGPLTVRLGPAGSVVARLLDDDGQPRRGVLIQVGYAAGQFPPGDFSPLFYEKVGNDGRFRIKGLLPGVNYNFGALAEPAFLGQVAAGIELEPGETRDLGEVKVQQPK
jgi:RNA polymerase sigma factor (sigma-70 family)